MANEQASENQNESAQAKAQREAAEQKAPKQAAQTAGDEKWFRLRTAADPNHPLVTGRSKTDSFITRLAVIPELAAAMELGRTGCKQIAHAEQTPVQRLVQSWDPQPAEADEIPDEAGTLVPLKNQSEED